MRALSRILVTVLMAPALLLGQAPKANASTPTATIIGVSDRAIDDDFDGLFNSIGITVDANIFEVGTYDVSVVLRASNGRQLQHSIMQTLEVGSASVEVTFSADSVVTELGVNGPWTVAEVRIFEQVGGSLVLQDTRNNLGSTAAYDLGFAQPTLTRLNGAHSAVGVDTDGNGRFNQLKVSFGVDVLVESDFYLYSFSLLDSAGKVLGSVRSGFVTLREGSNTIEATFPGLPIGQNGVDGPYVVGNLHVSEELFGSNTLDAPVVFNTPAFRASQFEGFVAAPPSDTAPPAVTVTATPNVLWPADRRMVEIHVTVSAIDDTDPNPIVSLVSITSNQGDTSRDVLIQNGKVFLRAERLGKGGDRVYTLMYSARDASGNVGAGSTTVTVPHDQGQGRK